MAKQKQCTYCKKMVPRLWYSSPPTCPDNSCIAKRNASKSKKGINTPEKKKVAKIKENNDNKTKSYTFRKSIANKNKTRKPTGEYKLFLRIFALRNGRCEITGEQISFNVSSFAHILSKGAYPRYRLNPDNIIMVKTRIHDMYDNRGKEELLKEYPEAIIIFERKEELRYKYYNP